MKISGAVSSNIQSTLLNEEENETEFVGLSCLPYEKELRDAITQAIWIALMIKASSGRVESKEVKRISD